MTLAPFALAILAQAATPEPLEVGVYQLQAREIPALAPAETALRPRETFPSKHRLAVEYTALIGADLAITEIGIASGSFEELVWRGGQGVRVLGNIVAGVFVVWGLDWLAEERPDVARWLRRLHLVVRGAAIANNVRLLARGPREGR